MTMWDLSLTRHHLLICNGGSCMMNGGEEVTQAIRDEIARLCADDILHTTRTRCNGRCEEACVVIAYPDGIWYKHVTPKTALEIVRQHAEEQQPPSPLISHRFGGQGFVRTEGTSQGVLKRDLLKNSQKLQGK